MIIILEGFDESGKSTLANKLAGKLGFKVVHPGKRPFDINDAIAMAERQFGLMSFAKDVNLIMDRVTCISSHCYMMNITHEFKSYQSAIDVLESQGLIKLIRCKYNGEEFKVTEHDRDGSVNIAKNNKDSIIKNYDDLFANLRHHEYDYLEKDAFYKVAKYIGFDMFDK